MSKLFSNLELSSLNLKHRVVLAPLTRSRAVAGGCAHTGLAALYYSQRTSEGGLLIAEAAQICKQGQGYPFTPGIFETPQIESWKKVTQAVHQKVGYIFLQLWHVGRVRFEDSVSSSDIPMTEMPLVNLKTYQQGIAQPPKMLNVDEIKLIVEQYGQAARNAMEAGFDGVELHAANGYLIDHSFRMVHH